MSGRALGVFAGVAVVGAIIELYRDTNWLIISVLVVAAAGAVALAISRARPARAALVLGVVVVVGGAGWTMVHVAEGVDDRRIEYRGKLDADVILDTFQHGAPRAADGSFTVLPGSAYLESGRGTATRPHATDALLAFWAFVELAPWVVGALVLALLLPVLRAADRGDPFALDAAGRLRFVGSVLLVGVPAIGFLQYWLGEFSSGSAVSPYVEPEWTVSLAQLLPGALVLVLSELFRRGTELRELERRTV